MPSNKQLIHKNFDKNVDNYKIITRIDTILNLIDNNEYCFIHKPLILQKRLKLFTRMTENYIEINGIFLFLNNISFQKKLFLQYLESQVYLEDIK